MKYFKFHFEQKELVSIINDVTLYNKHQAKFGVTEIQTFEQQEEQEMETKLTQIEESLEKDSTNNYSEMYGEEVDNEDENSIQSKKINLNLKNVNFKRKTKSTAEFVFQNLRNQIDIISTNSGNDKLL